MTRVMRHEIPEITPTRLPACMGGFCAGRDHCARHVTDDRVYVVERLCERGKEQPTPVRVGVIQKPE